MKHERFSSTLKTLSRLSRILSTTLVGNVSWYSVTEITSGHVLLREKNTPDDTKGYGAQVVSTSDENSPKVFVNSLYFETTFDSLLSNTFTNYLSRFICFLQYSLRKQGDVPHEGQYIKDESRRLLRMNQDLQSPSIIADKIAEFNTRIETALHYKIPYPRPVNVVPGATGRRPDAVMPIYLHSYQQAHATPGRWSKRLIKAPEYED